MCPAEEAEKSFPAFPERIDRYELLLPIGTGGMATVFLARAHLLEDIYQFVALKLMHPQLLAEDAGGASAFLEEARLANRIRHPNVVPILDVGRNRCGVYLVMEYVEGDTISGLVRGARGMVEKTVPLSIAGRVLSDALCGLHAAHELTGDSGESLGLVHRDFTPQNILVGVDGIGRLTDFGIAKAAGRGATTTGVAKGKAGYMAPEQALCKPLDRRADIWAAGVLAWELLAGQHLFDSQEPMATMFRVVSEVPPSLRTVRQDLPEELVEAVAWALTRDPELRPPSAEAFRQKLMAAWTLLAPLADSSQVGEYVRSIVKSKLQQRREHAEKVLSLRRQMGQLASTAHAIVSADAQSTDRTGDPLDTAAEDIGAGVADTRSEVATVADTPARPGQAPQVRNHKRTAVGVAGLAAFAVLGAIGWRQLRSRPLDTQASAASDVRAESSVPARETSSADALATASSARSEMLKLRSDTPIAALLIGNRTIALAPASRQVEAVVSADELAQLQQIECTAADGRHATVPIPVGSSAVEVVFGAPAQAKLSVEGRTPATARSSGRTKKPSLAPSPYERGP